ncbi:double-strand break repair protein mus-23-like [Panicum miliaceum]|uniref:Double-strand break repair protein mus-23-like n=1 Tax=Panicum miliaceum TaxID=4540 RepID=A0A3L6RKU0_PANMI|nr:double-strand break repair protein mus-23-like [Panicum miliaceum]
MAVVALCWWPLAPWLSPAAAWFVFFNAVVGAIAAMSCGARADAGGAARRGLGRSGSSLVLDRLRSFSIFAAHPAAGGVVGAPADGGDGTSVSASTDDPHCYYCCSRGAEEAAAAQEHPEQAVAAPTGGTVTSSVAPPIAPAAPAPAEEDHAAPAPAPDNQEDKAEAEEEQDQHEAKKEAEAEEQDGSISLDEAYALSQRHRAQELASPPPPTPPQAPATATVAVLTKKPAKKTTEGISRRRTKAEEALGGKAELNARAELFIRQFREELRLQRINSILSHTHALRSPTAAR